MQQQMMKWLEAKRQKGELYGTQWGQIPLQQTEVKKLLRNKQDKDEAEVIKNLAGEGGIQSVAARIYETWNLDRQQIKECHIAMSKDRQLQVTFNNIVAATRFKTFEGQRFARARRQNKGCVSADSWEHFLSCFAVPDISKLTGPEKMKEIVNICKKEAEPNSA